MIKVTVELISAIHPSRNRVLGVATITNDGTGTETIGNYDVSLSKAGGVQEWRGGRVEGFKRLRLGGWDLLYRALRNIVGSRSP